MYYSKALQRGGRQVQWWDKAGTDEDRIPETEQEAVPEENPVNVATIQIGI